MPQNVETFDYEKIRSTFSLNIPDDFNFAFDVLAKKAAKANKTALIAINQAGNYLADVSYNELDRSS